MRPDPFDFRPGFPIPVPHADSTGPIGGLVGIIFRVVGLSMQKMSNFMQEETKAVSLRKSKKRRRDTDDTLPVERVGILPLRFPLLFVRVLAVFNFDSHISAFSQ